MVVVFLDVHLRRLYLLLCQLKFNNEDLVHSSY
jgi:hypothetical protein